MNRTPLTQLLTALVLFASSLSSMQAFAEEIVIPIGQQAASAAIKTPSTGMDQQDVSSAFGLPVSRSPSVGQPPISRWEYAGFYVYFEYDKVIHSVRKP